MRPDTVELFVCLACNDVRKSINEFVHLDAATLDANSLNIYALECAAIADTLKSLEDLLLTAAKELDTADQNAEGATYHPGLGPYQSTDNVMLMTHEEHAEAHAPLK